MKTIKEIDKDFEYITTLGETMDSRDMSNQYLGYKTALKDILKWIDENSLCSNCRSKLKARIEGK